MRALLLTAFLGAALVSGAGVHALNAPGAMDRARDAYAVQDYRTATEESLVALTENATDLEALELLARAQVATGEGVDALATLERLEKAGVSPDDSMLLRAEALLQTGDRDAALALLEGERSAEAYRLRALAAMQEGDAQAAMRAFDAGRNAPGDKRKLLTAAATFHLDRGEPDAARAAIGRVQTLASDAIDTLFVSARLAQVDERHDLAARAFMAILERTPEDRPALLGAIGSLATIERIDLLRPLVERGRTTYPGDIEFIYRDAELAGMDGEWQAARNLLQEHEGAVQQHAGARALYGKALLELGQLELARAQITPLYRREPRNAAYARILTEVLLASGESAEARRVIRPFADRANADPLDRALAERAARS